MRAILVTGLLLAIKAVSNILFSHRLKYVGDVPSDPWKGIRVIAVLNHTSLYEPLLLGFAPFSLIWQIAHKGVLPVAEKTMKRKIGLFFRFLVRHVIVVTRARDHTWRELLKRIDSDAVSLILPEGRMKRRTGLDSDGKPMTVRSGIADILGAQKEGRLLILYSGGLHHIQAPGELLARPFRTIHARIELIDIAQYRTELGADESPKAFRKKVVRDLTERRDQHCAAAEAESRGWSKT